MAFLWLVLLVTMHLALCSSLVLRQSLENFIIFYVIWCTSDPEVDSWLSSHLECVTCLSYLPVDTDFWEVTPGIVSVFSAELGSTLDTCCLVRFDVVWW